MSPVLVAFIVALACGLVGSVIGGAAGGLLVGRQALGNELAALMGSFYGPLAGGTGVALGLLALVFG
jgi:hypothetical protein